MPDSLFGKDSSFIVRSQLPFNGGPPPRRAARSFVTPVEDFFVRTHAFEVPTADVSTFTLDVGGMVRAPLRLTLDELRSRFATHQVAATMQCAGNRRDQLMSVEPITGEVPWSIEAISNGVWEGMRLKDVLDAAGIDAARGATDVEFIGLDQVERHGHTFGYGGSIPLAKARADEVLIAWAMNGKPLEPVHGFPLRAVVPGYIGARNVKWLKQINVLDRPSANFFQASAYKVFPPDVRAATADWNAATALGEFNISSAITSPEPGANLAPGMATVAGWAIGSAGNEIVRVEVSGDRGRSWAPAQLLDSRGQSNAWTWRLWEARLPLTPGEHQLVVRATDSAGNTQPADAKALWNFKGYMNNAWHRVNVAVR